MPTKSRLEPRPAGWQGVTLPSLLLVIGLTTLALCLGALMGGCTSEGNAQAVRLAQAVPQPGADVSQTIRARVAAVVKSEVQAHPATAPWVNGLAQACFEVSGFKLPSPAVLQSLFGVATVFAPADIAKPVGAVLDLYAQDYQTASAIQGGSKAYLTALGQGIQDGVTAAKVGEAP